MMSVLSQTHDELRQVAIDNGNYDADKGWDAHRLRGHNRRSNENSVNSLSMKKYRASLTAAEEWDYLTQV